MSASAICWTYISRWPIALSKSLAVRQACMTSAGRLPLRQCAIWLALFPMRRSSWKRAGSIGWCARPTSTLPLRMSCSHSPETVSPAFFASILRRRYSSGVSLMVTVLLRGAASCVRGLAILKASKRFMPKCETALSGGVKGSGAALSPCERICNRLPASAVQTIANPHLATPRLGYVLHFSCLHALFSYSQLHIAHCHNSRNYMQRQTWLHISERKTTCEHMKKAKNIFAMNIAEHGNA